MTSKIPSRFTVQRVTLIDDGPLVKVVQNEQKVATAEPKQPVDVRIVMPDGNAADTSIKYTLEKHNNAEIVFFVLIFITIGVLIGFRVFF